MASKKLCERFEETIMNNIDQLVKELLAEKDPETLLRRVRNLAPIEVFEATKNDECLRHVAKAIRDNPELKNKLQDEADEYFAKLKEEKAKLNLGIEGKENEQI